MEGEIALLRSLTNRLLSKRPIDHVQISRYLRILARSLPANSQMPRELTDQEQIDALIKKAFHKTVDEGKISFYDLLPVRTARPGEKWWPWRHFLSLEERRRYGLIDPDDRWPREVDERLAEEAAHDAEMSRDIEAVLEIMFDNDPVLSILNDPDQEAPNPDDDDEDPPPYGEAPPTLTDVPEKSAIHPLPDTSLNEEPPRDYLPVIPAEVEDVVDVVDAPGRAPCRAEIHPREESRLPSKTPQPDNPPQQDAPSRESIPHDDPTPASPTPRRTARGRPRPP